MSLLYQSKEKGVKGKITDLNVKKSGDLSGKAKKNSSRPRPTATILSILWLRVEINGRGYENILPPGAGDLSISPRSPGKSFFEMELVPYPGFGTPKVFYFSL